MVYGIGINGNNNYWIPDSTFVGTSSMPTSLWSYDFSAMSPQDSLGTWNDSGLFNFDWATNNLVNQVAVWNAKWMPVLSNYMANMSALYQNSMMNLSANTNVNFNPFGPVNSANSNVNVNSSNNDGKISYANKIEESDVSSFVGKLGMDPKWKAAFSEEITLDDGTKMTILQRLVDLCNDYLTNEDPELSDEEFKTIQEIAGKYAKTGKITRDDFLTLKRIVMNHLSDKVEDESDTQDDTDKAHIRPEQNVIERANAANGYQKTAHNYFEAMDGAGTDKKELNNATRATNKYNVVETIQTFNEENALEGDGLTLAEKIFDECNNWNTGNNHGLWSTNGWGDDDAKPYIEKITDSLIERTNDFIKAGKCSKETAEELKNAVINLENTFNSVDKGDLSKGTKEAVASAVDSLFEKLHSAEQAAYKKYDEETNITDDQVIK